ncbi:hypothetical protein KKA39_03235, partial [Patescibacteria group bacterium]|nr:hypothetical protein [Patescibacteria group bacterium]
MTDTEKVIEKQRTDIKNSTTGYWESYIELQNFILGNKKADKERIIIFVDSIEGFREKALFEISEKIDQIKTTGEIKAIKNDVENGKNIKMFSDVSLNNLIEQLNDIIEKKNRSGEIPFTLMDEYSKMSPLITPEHQRIIFHRSISQLENKPVINRYETIKRLNAIIKHLSSKYCSDSDKLFFKNKVKEIHLEPQFVLKTSLSK